MELSCDNDGYLIKAKGKFGYSRDVTLSKWNGKVFVHITDSSKCFENGTYDKTKSKTISINWSTAVNLKNRLDEMVSHVSRIEAEMVSVS